MMSKRREEEARKRAEQLYVIMSLCASPSGATTPELRLASGMGLARVQEFVRQQRAVGKLFVWGASNKKRYFANQADCLDYVPPKRDPAARVSALCIDRGTEAAKQCREMLDAVRKTPGLSAKQLSDLLNVDIEHARDRMRALERDGLAHKTSLRGNRALWFDSKTARAEYRAEASRAAGKRGIDYALLPGAKSGTKRWSKQTEAVIPEGLLVQEAPYRSNYRTEIVGPVDGQFSAEWRELRHVESEANT